MTKYDHLRIEEKMKLDEINSVAGYFVSEFSWASNNENLLDTDRISEFRIFTKVFERIHKEKNEELKQIRKDMDEWFAEVLSTTAEGAKT